MASPINYRGLTWTNSSFIILALIVGTIYLRLKPNTSTFFSRASVIFLCVVHAP